MSSIFSIRGGASYVIIFFISPHCDFFVHHNRRYLILLYVKDIIIGISLSLNKFEKLPKHVDVLKIIHGQQR